MGKLLDDSQYGRIGQAARSLGLATVRTYCANLSFHGPSHTVAVQRRTTAILDALIGPGPSYALTHCLASIAASFHDAAQHEGSRRNEAISASLAIAFMDSIDGALGVNAFGTGGRELVREAIMTTIAAFDPTMKTAVQPELSHGSRVVARALALADLGAAGVDGPEAFLADGDALFRELNPSVAQVAAKPARRSAALLPDSSIRTEAEENECLRLMRQWSDGQVSFAEGRRDLLERELGNVSPRAKQQVRALFCRFEESIAAARDRAERRRGLPFSQLCANVGIQVT